ncbi:MAG: GIY-YIG nuclease family protein [Xenococcaceae cyanobacterium]
MYADEVILSLGKVDLKNKKLLPEYSGIYYVIDDSSLLWYIGQAKNIKKRWSGKSHHRIHQLSFQKKKKFFICYCAVEESQLDREEQLLITKYQPYYFSTKSTTQISYNDFLDIMTMPEIEKTNSEKFKPLETSVKRFKRKFISVCDEEMDLDWELELCIDEKERLFVRHHVYTFLDRENLSPIRNYVNQRPEDYISNLKHFCMHLRNPFKWIGYKFCCEDVILIDEEDNLEIEVIAIMLPFTMFVDLLEDKWSRDLETLEAIKTESKNWFRNQKLDIKVRKWLYDNQKTLSFLANE